MWISRALVLALVAASWATGPAVAAEETCRGRAATIVGEPHGTVVGTAGDDVIVTNGAEDVDAGDGDDTICVTATTRTFVAAVDAGPGNDTVDTTATREDSTVRLGTGTDALDGGTGNHDVSTGPSDGSDADYDSVHTLGGNDRVVTGEPGQPDPDDIDLGRGDGAITVRSERPTGVLRAAPGTPAVLRVGTFTAGRWLVDQAAEQVSVDGQVVFGWANLALEQVDAVAEARVRYVGTIARDYLYLLGGTAAGVDLRGGGDVLYVGPAARVRGLVDGGAGSDTIEVVAHREVHADLRSGEFSRDRVPARVRGFRNLKAFGAHTTVLHGTPGPNFLYSDACTYRIRGGEGDDEVYSGTSRGPRSQCLDRAVDVRLFAGPGDDYLSGGSVNDRLLGGPGHDTAHGHNGRDVCRAEERIACEA